MKNRLMVLALLIVSAALAPFTYGNVRIETFDDGDGFAESRVTCMIQDKRGVIWLSSWDGLYRYNGYRLQNYKARPGDNCPLDINRIDYIRELADGDILCRVRNDYFTFNKQAKRFSVYTGRRDKHDIRYMPDSATARMVHAMKRYDGKEARIMFKDRQGGIWVHSTLGLDRIAPVPKPIGNRKMGTGSNEQVRGLMEDSRRRLWIADKNGYVRLMDSGGRLIGYVSAAGKIESHAARFGHSVYCMHEDRHGTVWLGTKFDGLFRLTPSGGSYAMRRFVSDSTDAYSLSHNDIYSLCEDSGGRLWIGTYGGGLNVTDTDSRGRLRFISSRNVLPALHQGHVEVHRLAITTDGVLLAGTNNGLYTARVTRDPAAMRFYSNRRDPGDAASLSNNRVTDIVAMGSGGVYVTTYGGGVCRILSKTLLSDTLRFKPYTTDTGMASDVAIAATGDGRGNIWIVSGASLTCLDTRNGVSTNFRKSIFSGGFVFSEAHPLCCAGGRLVIGTSQGTLEFNPAQLRKSSYVPPIVTDCGGKVSLTPYEKSLTIEMAALDYNKNEQIEYAYRLDGVDRDWNYTTDNRIIYASIPAGEYVLHIKSTNGDGIWVDNETTVDVCRTPRFNETPLAWMIYGGLLLAVLYAAVKVTAYIRRLRRELSDIKLTTNEKIEYVLLKSGEKSGDGQPAERPSAAQTDADAAQDKRWAADVRQFLDAHIGDTNLSVDSFARAMCMSRSVFYLNMKRVFGVTPNSFIQDERIARAGRMLSDNNVNVSEVAYKCGFSDPKYFSRCFKKATGMKPSEVRGKTEE